MTPYDILLERILLGDYRPGTSLVEKEIARELGVSRTPVREALLRLKLEGLVEIIPRGGIFVAEASVQKIREVTEVRLVLEDFAARLAADRCPEEILKAFRGWLRELKPGWHRLSPREWMKKDMRFHQFVDEATGNETLSRHLALLRRQAVLFWGQFLDGRSSLEGIIQDFEETLEALEKRDAERCARVFRKHVLDHVDRISQYLKPNLDRLVASR